MELHMKPMHARIIHVVDGAAVETKKVMVDYSSRLCDVMELFKYCLPKMNFNEDYAVQFNTKDGSPFLNTNQSLQMLGFDPVKDVISLVSVKMVAKSHWQRFGTIIKRGWISIGSGKDIDGAEKGQRKYAVLIEHFLVLFKKEGEMASQAIALDVHSLKRRKDDKGQIYLTLTRLHPKKEERERNQSVAAPSSATAPGGGAAKMKHTVMGVVSNMQQKVLGSGSKNVWVITGDDVGTPESLELWFRELSAKCANTGVRRLFGIPLEETLSLKNKRLNHVPPIISKIVSYLDHKLETEGLFRLQGSHALVDSYRDKFELGVEFDLNECLDPHVPATIMKQFLRELPEPLLQFANYDTLIEIAQRKIPIETKKELIFARLKDTLPPLNMGVLLFLLGFLSRVNRMSDINKMGLANLGTVFGPNLLRTEEDNPMLLLNHTAPLNEIVQILIQYEHDLTAMMSGFNPLHGVSSPWAAPTPSSTIAHNASAPSVQAAPNAGSGLSQSGHFPAGRPRGPTTVADAIALNQSSPNLRDAPSLSSSSGSNVSESETPTLLASASNPALAVSAAPPNNGIGGSAKKGRPKGGHYASIAPLPVGGPFASPVAFVEVPPSQTAQDVPTVPTQSFAPNLRRYSTAVEPVQRTGLSYQSSAAPKGGISVLPRGPQLGGVINHAASQGINKVFNSSAAPSPPPQPAHSTPPANTAVAPLPPSMQVNTANLNYGTTSPVLSPRAAPPPPLALQTGTATFAPPPPISVPRDAYTKQLEEQVQVQKTQIQTLESELQRLQQLLQDHNIAHH
jgi:hypothetical protein